MNYCGQEDAVRVELDVYAKIFDGEGPDLPVSQGSTNVGTMSFLGRGSGGLRLIEGMTLAYYLTLRAT